MKQLRSQKALAVLSISLLCGGLLATAVHAAKPTRNDEKPNSLAGAHANETEHPSTIAFIYTGASCSTWLNSQFQTASCIDYFDGASEVRIVARQSNGQQHIWFDGTALQGEKIVLDPMNGDKLTFTGAGIVFDIFDFQGTALQTVEIGIEDPELLVEGDTYGSLTLQKVGYRFKIPPDQKDYSQYIVSFQEGVRKRDIEDYAAYWAPYGVEVSMKLWLIDALVLRVPDYVVADDLAADPRVAGVEHDQILGVKQLLNGQGMSFIRPLDHPPARLPTQGRYEYPWSAVKLYDQLIGYYSTASPSAWLEETVVTDTVRLALEQLGQARLKIAFFDTGIHPANLTVGERVKGGVDIVNPRLDKKGRQVFQDSKPVDNNGHGTHVAGVLAAILDSNYAWGRDAGVALYGVKILNQYAMGSISNILMGLQWAVDNDIDIVNMSIGYSQDSPALQRAIQRAYQEGLIMVASVGNHSNYDDSVVLQGIGNGSAEGGSAEGGSAEGGSAEGGSAEGGSAEGGSAEGGSAEGGSAEGGSAEGGSAEGGSAEGGSGTTLQSTDSLPLYAVMYPARYPEVIAVAASTRQETLASFSNTGPEMDISAPGTDILSADITNGDILTGFGSTSGTSMATPYVTATIALMLALDPTLNTEEIRDILKQTAFYSAGARVGDLNLIGALDAVLIRPVEQTTDSSDTGKCKNKHCK